MKQRSRFTSCLVILLLATTLSACKPPPEEVCDQFGAKLDSMGEYQGLSEQAKTVARAECLARMAAIKDQAPEAYGCVADCVEKTPSAGGLLVCPGSCAHEADDPSVMQDLTSGDPEYDRAAIRGGGPP